MKFLAHWVDDVTNEGLHMLVKRHGRIRHAQIIQVILDVHGRFSIRHFGVSSQTVLLGEWYALRLQHRKLFL